MFWSDDLKEVFFNEENIQEIEIDEKEVLCGYFVADSSVLESTVKETLRSGS